VSVEGKQDGLTNAEMLALFDNLIIAMSDSNDAEL
jgi:hypothetical protein